MSVATAKLAALACFLITTESSAARGQAPAGPIPSIQSKTVGLQKFDGFFPIYWDDKTGKMWLEISRFNSEFLLMTSLPAGVGNNDLGLDRGSVGEPKVVHFEKSGPRVLLMQSNYEFRATAESTSERRAAEQSFARSVLWGFDVAGQDNNTVLVDATSFFLRDGVGVVPHLATMKQGSYHFDPQRSAFYLQRTRSFPRNTEVEVTVTLGSDQAGPLVRSVTPTAESLTVREHYSLIQLPDDNFKPREMDPRAGYFGGEFMDFSAPIDQPVEKHFIYRHRLVKKDATAELSDPVAPIIYYVDPGAPEDIRKALIEGASWWNDAFEAAGFKNAFIVKVLPPDADPMDVRYNIIQWVHRSTRGWSYGNPVADPRTGEIIKGVVSLGSLREHQDYLIFESLLAPHTEAAHNHDALKEAVYARLRQLAAHEVGHTLGLAHNYIASTDNRASVMDYPHPLITLKEDNTLDLSEAYATGIGEWDKVAIAYGYSQFPLDADEHAELNKIIDTAAKAGDIFITDQDSRPLGSAHPKSHLWDNGPNAVDELTRLLKIRAVAFATFGDNSIEIGAPWATLDEALVPLYFLHRYQTEAAGKVLGGNNYTYALRGDGQVITEIVPAAEQRRALNALLDTIRPDILTLPDRILSHLPPHPPGYPRTRETFPYRTGMTFDPLAGAEAASNLTVSLLLNPERAARLVQYHAQSNDNPGLDEVTGKLIGATWGTSGGPGLGHEIMRTTRFVVLTHLMSLAADDSAPAQVRAIASLRIDDIKKRAAAMSASTDVLDRAQGHYAVELIDQFSRDPCKFVLPKAIEPPPGQPIGGADEDEVWVPRLIEAPKSKVQ